MSTIQIEGLWQYIQTLSLSKKEAEEGMVTTFASVDDFKKHMYELQCSAFRAATYSN